MNVGDYVRTKDGFIARIKEIKKNERLHLFLKAIYTDNYKIDMILENEIIKSSPNIIDLIEVGDYVNGGKVFLITDGIDKHLRVADEKGTWCIKDIYEEGIKSIVTKEQFLQMEYKVGE